MKTELTSKPDSVKTRNWLSRLKSWLFPEDDLGRINGLILPLILTGVLAAFWVGWKANAVGPVMLWVFASFVAGGTAGFLFGIPKAGISSKVATVHSSSTNATATRTPDRTFASNEAGSELRARPNTNLEEVSDWLTKILVGLTLVHLEKLQEEVHRISLNAAASIQQHPTASAISAATALVVGFALIGFLSIYLYMRLFVQGAIVRSDEQMHQYRSAVARAEQIGQYEPEANPEDPVAVIPSPASLIAAQDVADAAPPNQPDLVLQPLRELACQYEKLRQDMDYSGSRTRAMTRIVHQMRPHAIAAAPYINEMIQSTSPGDHLAATVILQMKYMPEHMKWLSRRLVEERAFIGYQAASALLARLRVAGQPECSAIRDAVASAKAERAQLNMIESSLDNLIDQILQPG